MHACIIYIYTIYYYQFLPIFRVLVRRGLYIHPNDLQWFAADHTNKVPLYIQAIEQCPAILFWLLGQWILQKIGMLPHPGDQICTLNFVTTVGNMHNNIRYDITLQWINLKQSNPTLFDDLREYHACTGWIFPAPFFGKGKQQFLHMTKKIPS